MKPRQTEWGRPPPGQRRDAEPLYACPWLSSGHAYASLGRRAKEEAALGGRPEDTRCVTLVGIARDPSRVLLHVAGRRAIGLRLAWGQAPVLVRFEAGLRDEGCILG
eukprot:scaffold41448_cov67-Phaeocystis_antarctica.AAC.8